MNKGVKDASGKLGGDIGACKSCALKQDTMIAPFPTKGGMLLGRAGVVARCIVLVAHEEEEVEVSKRVL